MHRIINSVVIPVLTVAIVAASPRARHAQQTAASTAPGGVVLLPTNHPHLPADASQLWMAPDRTHTHTAAMNEFAAAVKLEVDSNYAKALPMFSQPSLQKGPLGDYAVFYRGLAELRLGQPADAKRTFQSLQAGELTGYLVEGAAVKEAECDEALGDQAGAAAIYERLSTQKTTAPDDVLMRLGRAAKASGDTDKAGRAFARVYYEYPLSDLSSLASAELDALPNVQPIAPGNNRYKLEIGRAERLFASKRYAQARTGFEGLRNAAQGDDRELVNLRVAECDFFLKRPRNARDEARPYIDRASRKAEAMFFYAVSTRELGDQNEYLKTIRQLADEFPAQTWTEEALNNLATHYILQSDDDRADATFREMYQKFPVGRYAERAAWKIGWWAYRNGRFADTTRVFEAAAADFPRSDYRPMWLYWSARAHDALNEKALAESRYTLAATDYLNSYYGRLAVKHLEAAPKGRPIFDTALSGRPAQETTPPPPEPGVAGVADAPAAPTLTNPIAALPPSERVIRALLGLELYDQAVDELHYAQKNWGDSSAIQATLGWIAHERGDLRAGINGMKRAYPQYLAAGGEQLPTELLKVLFPVNYWPEIRRYAAERHLDPYLMAALIAQESTFTADAKSSANAYGLMQIVPAAGRHYASVLHLKRFSIGMLTTADTNLKMGTAYFADLVARFGGAHYALASYNAGESRVVRWIAERPGVEKEVFIDDIPFPETQNYVKKILGTAEDYRRLYPGAETTRADAADEPKPAVATPAAKKKAAPPPVKKKIKKTANTENTP